MTTPAPALAAPVPWPLPWNGRAPGHEHGYPPVGWPSLGQLVYTKEAITVLLLVLALPWLLRKLLTRPGDVLSGLGRRATSRVSGG